MINFLKNLRQKTDLVLILTIVFLVYLLFRQNSILKSIRNDLIKNLTYLKELQAVDKEELNKQLSLLREELIKYKSQQEGRDQILGLTKLNQAQTPILPTPNQFQTDDLNQSISTASDKITINGIVKLKKNWQSADVFLETKASSKIVGQIVKDKLYFVYETQPGWYKIEYQPNQHGWIQSSLVDEL